MGELFARTETPRALAQINTISSRMTLPRQIAGDTTHTQPQAAPSSQATTCSTTSVSC
jgi:hypothetical protein